MAVLAVLVAPALKTYLTQINYVRLCSLCCD